MNISTTRNTLVQKNASTVASKETPSQKKSGHAMSGALRRMSLAILMVATAVVAISVVAPSAFGQASSSSDIAGKVSDSTGASIP